MEFSGEYRIAARQQRVWNALSDPAVLQACIAGCSRVEKKSDSEMIATVVVAVGPISATFKGDVSLCSLSGPIGFTLAGKDGAAALAGLQARVSLSEDQDHTVLKYVATAEIGDPLEGIGGWLAQTLATMNADEFFAAFARHLSATGAQDPAVPVALPAPAAPLSGPVPASAEQAAGKSGALATPMSRWLFVLAAGLGFVLGYCFARFL